MNNIEQLVATLSKDAATVKPAPHPYGLGLKWLGLALAYLAISLAVFGMRPDLARALQNPWFVAELAALFGMLVTTALSAALLAFPDLYQKRRLAMAPAGMFVQFVLLMAFSWHADVPPAPLPAHSFECSLSILLFSLLPAVAIFQILRRYAGTHPQLSGIVAVLFAFTTGAFWLRLHESNDSIIHVIEWHYLPMLAVILVGYWSGKKMLKW